MEKKRLFNRYEAATPDGQHLQSCVGELLRPIIKRYAEEGFSLVDIEFLVTQQVTGDLACLRLQAGIALKREERAQAKPHNFSDK